MNGHAPIEVLFVDDEQDLLNGLRTRLRRNRKKWHMRFASSGEQALQMIEERSIDVVVSDMRMPAMNGAQLLTQITKTHPDTARIVLSGYAEPAMMIDAIPVAHRFISKPCDLSVLEQAIDDTSLITHELNDQHLNKVISGLAGLPVLSDSYTELLALLEDDTTCEIEEVGQVIERDSAMTARILQIANSSWFGGKQVISSISDAVSRLGLNIIKSLVLREYLGQQLDLDDHLAQNLVTNIDHHSQEVAAISSGLADSFQRGLAQSSGLLHDIGKLVFLASDREKYLDLAASLEKENQEWLHAERQLFGCDHAQLGAKLLELWGIPPSIVSAVAGHAHLPTVLGDDVSDLIAFADRIAHNPDFGEAMLDQLPSEIRERYHRTVSHHSTDQSIQHTGDTDA